MIQVFPANLESIYSQPPLWVPATTFDSTKGLLNDLLREIIDGEIQLPDFQRGWVWDDNHIRELLVSIARSFPIGASMLLESGGEVYFETRPIEGLEEKFPADKKPEKLILDGQQRLTTLTQAIGIVEPVSRGYVERFSEVYFS